MSGNDKLVLVGKVTATHGIKGQLRVVPFSGDSDSITSHRTLIFMDASGNTADFEIANSSVHGKKVLVTLKDHSDINSVECLVGREVYVKRAQLPDLPDGEYYWCDLIGLEVVTTAGNSLGQLSEIIDTGGNDVYLVKQGDKEYLIPAVEDIVTGIDPRKGVVTVDPPDGLLDL